MNYKKELYDIGKKLNSINLKLGRVTSKFNETQCPTEKLSYKKKMNALRRELKEIKEHRDKIRLDFKEIRKPKVVRYPTQYVGRVFDKFGTVHHTRTYKSLQSALTARRNLATNLELRGLLERGSPYTFEHGTIDLY